MFELPEYSVLARQINETLRGKTVHTGSQGNSPHKFVWHNRTDEEFARLVKGKIVGEAFVRGRWLFIPLEPGQILLLGECGGKLLFHQPGSAWPKKYHLSVEFTDGSFLTATTQMWGAMELYETDAVWNRQYIKDMRPIPTDPEFTPEYFHHLVDEACEEKKTSAKALLTADQWIPGLGNAIAQDILFTARIHPKQDMASLPEENRKRLYDAIQNILRAVIDGGGRYDEINLYGDSGGYIRLMDRNAAGKPCSHCGTIVEKISYMGGSCYVCPGCQPSP
jgi:formamidopyrimidine-DNA glycosylase